MPFGLVVPQPPEPRAQLLDWRRVRELQDPARPTDAERERVRVLRLARRAEEAVAERLRPEVEPVADAGTRAESAGVHALS